MGSRQQQELENNLEVITEGTEEAKNKFLPEHKYLFTENVRVNLTYQMPKYFRETQHTTKSEMNVLMQNHL